MYSVSSQIRDGIGRSLFICSWESHRSSTCPSSPATVFHWPFGGVVTTSAVDFKLLPSLWSHPVFNVKEGLGVKKICEGWFLPIRKSYYFGQTTRAGRKWWLYPTKEFGVGSTYQLRSFLSHLPNSHPSWGPLSTNIMAWIAGSQFLVDLCSGKWSKIQVLSFRRWKQVPACLPRNTKIVVSST